MESLQERRAWTPEWLGLKSAATALQRRLEAENEQVVQRLQAQIQSGQFTPTGLRAAFQAQAGAPGPAGEYDNLDLLVGGVLGVGAPAEERAVREPDMVFYQPTPAQAVLGLLDRLRLGPGDTLVDLGAGLGRVVLLTALFTDAAPHGIEFEPSYCEYAMRSATHLKVGATFVQADARTASLAEGTVFFMYTPFRGAMLQQVLSRLQVHAMGRSIRVCTYGPCTAEVARTPWLKRHGPLPGEREVAVFESAQHPAAGPGAAIQY
jgi:hypothetical protein